MTRSIYSERKTTERGSESHGQKDVNIYFVRHTEYQDPDKLIPGRLPVPLSDVGKQHAQKLADFFQDKEISKIYSSAVLRCQQTSEIISQNKIPIVYDQRLLEVFTAYQGFTFKDGVDFEHFYGHRKELGGESYKDLQERMVTFFEDLQKEAEGSVLVVSHGDPLYTLYLFLQKKPLGTEEHLIETKQTVEYPEKGSVRELVIENNTFTLKPFLTFK